MIRTIEEQRKRGDFAHLSSRDEYAQYFSLLQHVLNCILQWVRVCNSESHVFRDFEPMVNRLLYTVALLRLKYLFNQDHELALDLNESGYPHSVGFSRVESALKNRDATLLELPKVPVLRDLLIDELLKKKTESIETLQMLAESAYYTGLDKDKLFLPFTPGSLEEMESKNPDFRSYNYTWATFGSVSNTPYLHCLIFEQDVNREPLSSDSKEWKELERTIQFASQNHPQVGVLAYQIDDASNAIHPKFLERVQLGPIFAPLINIGGAGAEFCTIIDDFGGPQDFILEMSIETIISKGSRLSSGIFSKGGKVREEFFIPNTDTDAFKHRASRVVRKLLLPHRVLQIARKMSFFDAYLNHEKITYVQQDKQIEIIA